jgi:DNA polymerase (family X)
MKHTLPKLVRDDACTYRSVGRVDTLVMMAEATRARGYEYFGVANHLKSAHYACAAI